MSAGREAAGVGQSSGQQGNTKDGPRCLAGMHNGPERSLYIGSIYLEFSRNPDYVTSTVNCEICTELSRDMRLGLSHCS